MTLTLLDLTGLKCPLPALLTRKALSRLKPGERLELRCTDPMAVIDIPAMVQQLGDRIDSAERRDDLLVFVIVRCDRTAAGSD